MKTKLSRHRRARIERCESRCVLSLTVPALSGLPGAPATVYLDFDGHFEAQWGAFQNITTPAFDRDGDPNNFSAAELDEINDIWAGVVEDFAPFNVNVTTVDPGDFSDGVGLRVAIGGSYNDWFGQQASGAAFIFSFINPLPNTVFVFENQLNSARRVADIASHESGHAFGLFHQSVWEGGLLVEEFNPGNPPDWAPLMGNPLLATRSTWHNGTTTSPFTTQDDIAVLGGPLNGFGFRDDDHGDDTSSATLADVVGSSISGSGIVGATDDLDYFAFETGAGQIDLTVDVAAFGPNLDATLELRDEFGGLITAVSPSETLSASITANVDAGTYYAVVGSQGVYGDIGQFTLSGSIVPPVNQNPTADAGGPYVLNEGDVLLLDASASFDPDLGDVLTYSWDLNGDAVFGDATGVAPSVTWAELLALGIDDGPQSFNVTVRVDDGAGGTDDASTTLDVVNIGPTADISGPSSAVPGQPRTYTLTATDPSPVDEAAGFTWSIDWDGDLVYDETVSGPSGTTVEHVFTALETANISVVAEDQDLDVGAVASTQTEVTRFALQTDETNPGLTNLAWGGTNGFDAVFFLPSGSDAISIFTFSINSQIVNSLDVVSGVDGRVFAYGLAFADVIVAEFLEVGVVFDGGAGADVLFGGESDDILYGRDGDDTLVGGMGDDQIFGGNGRDLLLGDEGGDLLQGEAGRDILVGGDGFDGLSGGAGQDIIISGTTDLDIFTSDWSKVQNEWNSSSDYLVRIDNLLGTGGATGANGNVHLEPDENLFDDDSVDILLGEDDLDWYILSLDQDFIFGPEPGEIGTDIEG